MIKKTKKKQNVKVVCLTPVKNEAWILDRFLRCTSLWADKIIIADQGSIDSTKEIAKKYHKVILIENNSKEFSEIERQNLLLDEARKISGDKVIITLDADEVFSSNILNDPEWETICSAPKGTVIKFQLINIFPDFVKYWSPPFLFPMGYIDDGTPHVGSQIHNPRIPFHELSPVLVANSIKILHYQYTDWERMLSKHRWYQCWEKISNPKRSALRIFRQYNHMNGLSEKDKIDINKEWLNGYTLSGIDMTSIVKDNNYWWDKEVEGFFDKYGLKYFSRLDIWSIKFIKPFGIKNKNEKRDPRSRLNKILHRWLRITQSKEKNYFVKIFDEIIVKLLRW